MFFHSKWIGNCHKLGQDILWHSRFKSSWVIRILNLRKFNLKKKSWQWRSVFDRVQTYFICGSIIILSSWGISIMPMAFPHSSIAWPFRLNWSEREKEERKKKKTMGGLLVVVKKDISRKKNRKNLRWVWWCWVFPEWWGNFISLQEMKPRDKNATSFE